jgi:hypothetical protein
MSCILASKASSIAASSARFFLYLAASDRKARTIVEGASSSAGLGPTKGRGKLSLPPFAFASR